MIKTEFNLYRQGFIHLSFSLGNKEKVNELTARLKNDGYKILSGPRTTGDGYYESCVFRSRKQYFRTCCLKLLILFIIKP